MDGPLLPYLAGLMTPLGAVCVIPLYPGYVALLAGSAKDEGVSPATIGVLVAVGVIGGMFAFGLIVSAVLGLSISAAIGGIAPFLYAGLAVAGAAMVAGVDLPVRLPVAEAPAVGGAGVSALLYGAFFGLIALPCNPGPIILLFALSADTAEWAANLLYFLLFGLGMATPLLLLSVLPAGWSRRVTAALARHHRMVFRVTGLFLLAVAVSYLAAAVAA